MKKKIVSSALAGIMVMSLAACGGGNSGGSGGGDSAGGSSSGSAGPGVSGSDSPLPAPGGHHPDRFPERVPDAL